MPMDPRLRRYRVRPKMDRSARVSASSPERIESIDALNGLTVAPIVWLLSGTVAVVKAVMASPQVVEYCNPARIYRRSC
jgi:hypothetical protein